MSGKPDTAITDRARLKSLYLKSRQHPPGIIDELKLVEKEDGTLDCLPKKDTNAMKYVNMALIEIENMELRSRKRLSELEKNRLALKFVEMNASPDKYDYYQRFTEKNQKKVKLNLN